MSRISRTALPKIRERFARGQRKERDQLIHPRLGLVCITVGPSIRYRTITRTRFLQISKSKQEAVLRELYRSNLEVLFGALRFCHKNGIELYRVTSRLFPMNDHPAGIQVLDELRPMMAPFGEWARKCRIRVVLHPDQFVVLNSENPIVVKQSVKIMQRHAYIFDLLGLPQTSWSAMIVHGGKTGRASQLSRVIRELPPEIRDRFALENDEYAYSASGILEVCQTAGVPMVFDAHHHVINAGLDSYDDSSLHYFVAAARATWPDPDWQLVHISNGASSFSDPCHSDLIQTLPSAFLKVPWIEVEAKAKEIAIAALRKTHRCLR